MPTTKNYSPLIPLYNIKEVTSATVFKAGDTIIQGFQLALLAIHVQRLFKRRKSRNISSGNQ